MIPPPLPPKPELEPPRSSWLSILLALSGASIVGAVLSLVTLFYLLPVFVIAAVVFMVAAFHYLVWGWWMRRFLEQHGEDGADVSAKICSVYNASAGNLVDLDHEAANKSPDN